EPGDDDPAFISLHADAELDQVIFDGSSFGTATFAGSDEESDYLGLPGLLNADQVRDLLRTRQSEQVAARSAAAEAPSAPRPDATTGAQLTALRKELNSLVAMHHHRTGKPHGVVHNELRSKLGGPPTAMATADQLRERISALRQWR
ncbi:MAG: ATP-dependent helicase, partial [Williamsia herbipolensis]|nr:ATP-dependent helicase [Williamsia herbipolensis]